MPERYEERSQAGRPADARASGPVDGGYARRIDCCDSPRSRELYGGGRGRGTLDAEAVSARTGRVDAD